MRPIKFRAWHKKEKRMCEVLLLPLYRDRLINRNPEMLVDARKYKMVMPAKWKIRDTILMQSTGLKDKNGKEIFEGDIIKWGHRIGKVYYELNYSGWHVDGGNGKIAELFYFEEGEVIGNIYENPELLKEAVGDAV